MIPKPPAADRQRDTKKLLAEGIRKNRHRLRDWHLALAHEAPPPFYCSIDLRDSGHKIVPVDSNLYPAGFNNICPEDLRAAPALIREQIDAHRPGARRILVIPESHTHNTNYIENLHYLTQLLTNAGCEVKVGWYGSGPEGGSGPIELRSATDKLVEAWPVTIEGAVLSAGGFTPDLIVLNNDFSGGYPIPFDQVSQPIVPSHALGWHTRKKSEHFRFYNELAREFAELAGVDPWFIQIDTEAVDGVNFNEERGLDGVVRAADGVLGRARAAYERYGIKQEPFVFIKNNAGTYGMGIMVVRSADEILKMNRRTKNKMSVGKNRQQIDSVVVQEGVPTATLVDRLAAEPVIYLSGCELIGGFLRTNTERSAEDNLNSTGMVFRKLCMSDLRSFGNPGEPREEDTADEPVLELVYGSIARISALATGRELLAHQRKRREGASIS